MKKILLLTAAMAFLAAPAFGAITGTKHDLSSSGVNTYKGDIDEICVYCHTPHAASTAVTLAPLWNRTYSLSGTPNAYDSSTLDAVIDSAGLNSSDVPLCLSCHDGNSVAGNLLNYPNGSGVSSGSGKGDLTGSIANILDGVNGLSNDHPVGFNYAAVAAIDSEINPIATVLSNTDVEGRSVAFYGAANEEMWCSSCHDVHGGDAGSPFLIRSNAGSTMCLACHAK